METGKAITILQPKEMDPKVLSGIPIHDKIPVTINRATYAPAVKKSPWAKFANRSMP
jgi:hypothetical protein